MCIGGVYVYLCVCLCVFVGGGGGLTFEKRKGREDRGASKNRGWESLANY